MPSRCFHRCAALLFVICLASPLAAEDEIPAPPWADEYYARQDLRQYLLDAEAYLKAHPDSPYAPRLAFEAMMTASIENKNAPFNAMRRRLLFDHPDSFEASYVLSAFDAKSYAKFLEDDLDLDVLADFTASERRLEGIAAAWKRWGKAIFEDDDVILKVAIIAQRHGYYRLATPCEQALKDKNGDMEEVAPILLDRALGNVEKLAQLSTLEKDNKKAKLTRQLLFAGLTPDERRSTEVLRIGVKDLLREKSWERALAAIDELLAIAPDDCAATYWRAWTLFALQRNEESQSVAKSLLERHADDAWAKAAAPLIEGLESREKTIDSFVALKDLLLSQQGALHGLETLVQLTYEDHPCEAYVAVRFSDQHLQFVLRIDGEMIVAYRSDAKESALYCAGDPAIQTAEVPGILPIPKLKVDPAVVDKWNFNFNLDFGEMSPENLAVLKETRNEIGKLFADRAALEACFSKRQQQGVLHFPIELGPSRATVRIINVSIDEPLIDITEAVATAQPNSWRIAVDKQGQGKADIRIATAADFEFTPPKWPELPIAKSPKFEASALVRSAASVVKVFEQLSQDSDEAEAETAGKEAAVK